MGIFDKTKTRKMDDGYRERTERYHIHSSRQPGELFFNPPPMIPEADLHRPGRAQHDSTAVSGLAMSLAILSD